MDGKIKTHTHTPHQIIQFALTECLLFIFLFFPGCLKMAISSSESSSSLMVMTDDDQPLLLAGKTFVSVK